MHFRLAFSAESGEWRKKVVDIRVAEAMYTKGQKYACIVFRADADPQLMLLKKRIDTDQPAEEIYSGVEMQTLGEMACKLLAAISPDSCRPHFLNTAAYVLKNRPGEPTVRVENFVEKASQEKLYLGILVSRFALRPGFFLTFKCIP